MRGGSTHNAGSAMKIWANVDTLKVIRKKSRALCLLRDITCQYCHVIRTSGNGKFAKQTNPVILTTTKLYFLTGFYVNKLHILNQYMTPGVETPKIIIITRMHEKVDNLRNG